MTRRDSGGVQRLTSVVPIAVLAALFAAAVANAVANAEAPRATAGPPITSPRPGGMTPGVAVVTEMPRIIRQGITSIPDPGRIQMPVVVTPTPVEATPENSGDDPASAIGRAGTGFFVGADGTLLTAAHVAKDCARMQVISRYTPRAWASLVATDKENDIAVLKAGVRPPAIVRVAASPPVSDRLFVLGYPASAGLTVAAETRGIVENQKFPPNAGPLADPRELLWMSAPAVAHGYSGGPVFDPKLGAVVGLVKGEVDAGYLRLVPDMPAAGIAIGPGIAPLQALVALKVAYAAVSLVSSPGEAGEDTLRRATVHVLCWR